MNQTEECSGVIVLGSTCGSLHVEVGYTLALVDIGYKDPAKCWNKRRKEERLCMLAAKAVNQVTDIGVEAKALH